MVESEAENINIKDLNTLSEKKESRKKFLRKLGQFSMFIGILIFVSSIIFLFAIGTNLPNTVSSIFWDGLFYIFIFLFILTFRIIKNPNTTISDAISLILIGGGLGVGLISTYLLFWNINSISLILASLILIEFGFAFFVIGKILVVYNKKVNK
jgi:hypothetical protein